MLQASNSSIMSSAPVGRVAVVTGANKGIGFFIASQLASSGLFSNVILGCRDATRGKSAVEEINKKLISSSPTLSSFASVSFLPLDLSEPSSHSTFKHLIEENFGGRIDVLVNNGALAFKGSDPTPFMEQTKPTLDVNFRRTLEFTEILLPMMRKHGNDARIVNVASMAGRLKQIRSQELQAQFRDANLSLTKLRRLVDQFESDVQNGVHSQKGWGSSNYGMSKLSLIAATKVLAREENAYGIKVNCCCPGYCDTDMTSHRGTRSPEDGAKNAVLLATMENCPTGEFVENLKVSSW